MRKKKKSGKRQMMGGVFRFAWAELKTMNMVKIKSLYQIGLGYLKMKYFTPAPPKQIERRIAH